MLIVGYSFIILGGTLCVRQCQTCRLWTRLGWLHNTFTRQCVSTFLIQLGAHYCGLNQVCVWHHKHNMDSREDFIPEWQLRMHCEQDRECFVCQLQMWEQTDQPFSFNSCVNVLGHFMSIFGLLFCTAHNRISLHTKLKCNVRIYLTQCQNIALIGFKHDLIVAKLYKECDPTIEPQTKNVNESLHLIPWFTNNYVYMLISFVTHVRLRFRRCRVKRFMTRLHYYYIRFYSTTGKGHRNKIIWNK